jgi:uncharacterized membrane protein YkvA (DUF1232 family)
MASPQATWRERLGVLKRDVVVRALAARDPRVPWYGRAAGACIIANALSPIDLIPDFIPVSGLLDELGLVPLGLLLAIHLISVDSLAERPVSRAAAVAAMFGLTAAVLAAVTAQMAGANPWGGASPP